MTFFIALIITVCILAVILSAEQNQSANNAHSANLSPSQTLEKDFSAQDLKTLKKELNLVNLNEISDVEMLKFIEHIDSVMEAYTPTLQMVKELSLSQIRTTMQELKRILNDMDLKDDKIYFSDTITGNSTLTREDLNLPPQEKYIEEFEDEEESRDAAIAGTIFGLAVADSLHEDNKKKLEREKEKLRRQMQDDFHFYSPEIARDYLSDMDKEDLD